MSKHELTAISDEELISHFYWLAVYNNRGKATKQSEKMEEHVVEEMSKRFSINEQDLLNRIRR